ncbi:hypothetical protein LINGRAHAP2_LOCUS9376 [Linum grandiflorum]
MRASTLHRDRNHHTTDHVIMTALNGAPRADPVIVPLHSHAAAAANGRPPRTVVDQIAALTIAAPIQALVFTDLVTEPPRAGNDLCVVGTFLTRREMNLKAIRRPLPSIMELGRGVESPDQVPRPYPPSGSWYFFCRLDIFSKVVGQTLGNFLGQFLKYDAKNVIEFPDAYMRIRILVDVRALLLQEREVKLHRKKEIMCFFMYERFRPSVFLWYLGTQGEAMRAAILPLGGTTTLLVG